MDFIENLKSNKILLMALGAVVVVGGIIAFVLLTGGDDEELHPITAQAAEAITNNKAEDALVLLMENADSLDQQGLDLLEELKSQFYSIYLEEAQKAETNADYVLAYEKYASALEVSPADMDVKETANKLRELEKTVEEIKQLQKDYTKYMKTFEKALTDSNILLKDFKTYLDNLEAGLITTAVFKDYFKNQIEMSNGILNELDTAFSIKNVNLLGIHQEVVNMINMQHDTLLEAVNLKDEEKAGAISTFKSRYLTIKQKQISLIQDLNDFADENHLKKITLLEGIQNELDVTVQQEVEEESQNTESSETESTKESKNEGTVEDKVEQ